MLSVPNPLLVFIALLFHLQNSQSLEDRDEITEQQVSLTQQVPPTEDNECKRISHQPLSPVVTDPPLVVSAGFDQNSQN